MMLIAVDAGGTRTRAAVVDDTGKLHGFGIAGSGNPTAVGREAADGAVVAALTAALDAAGTPGERILGGAVCSAGQHDADRVRSILTGAGIRTETPVVLVGDAVGAYLAVADEPTGLALVVGTGSVAIRVEGTVITEVFDGAGWLLGDLGSGFWLGQAVAQAVAADIDGRGPKTSLTQDVLKRIDRTDSSHWGSGRHPDLLQLLRHSYSESPVRLARLAKLAFLHSRTDSVAAKIVDVGAKHVAATLRAARASGAGLPIACSGSVLIHGYLGVKAPSNSLAVELSNADFRRCEDGIVGAAVLALHEAGVSRSKELRETLGAVFSQVKARR
ncbi:BadF/BadG/BcrA/BcrD ATPase family protein [Leucobacter aridicollis]|uniref:N-acetylglucosamine kinase n=2 Tax=Leucobacter aridicollis TaxID=283878 RepID=UPI00163DD554|nr:hypothetical protein [Leucobacter aridicollis]